MLNFSIEEQASLMIWLKAETTFHERLNNWWVCFSVFVSIKGFLSIDIDVSELQVNQCSARSSARSKEPLTANQYYNEIFSQIEIFHESNKCHSSSMLVSWTNHCLIDCPSVEFSICVNYLCVMLCVFTNLCN